ncbi:hypothetical protein K3495_g3067 [Podosphaera aphanis]|nr:hypothetical protein K3495_g3067 [Podosphaera aphanis]
MTATLPSPLPLDPPVPLTPQAGTWKHPKLDEIVRRQEASTFSKQNIKNILYNILGIMVTHYSARELPGTFLYDRYAGYIVSLIQLALMYNIVVAFLPLFRQTDKFTDISLTPAQRKLLGIYPVAVAPTPESEYSTPPRYQRTSTPLSGSPINWGKARLSENETRSPRSIPAGSQFSPLGRFDGNQCLNSTPRVVEAPGTPSPKPKGSTLLNSKWLYDKGRRNSGSSRLYL